MAGHDATARAREVQALKRKSKELESRFHILESRIHKLKYSSKAFVYRPIVDSERCFACGTCRDSCPTGAISIESHARIDLSRCTGCGLCAQDCPHEAITMGPVEKGL